MAPSLRLGPRRTANLLRVITHLGALAPLALSLYQINYGGLGADPVRTLTLRTGDAAFKLLLLALAVTPLATVTGWRQHLRLRRTLGLYTFFYAAIHFLIFVWLDYGLNLDFILLGIFDQPFVLVGFAAFLILLPLAATSFTWAQRRLGKNWKRLHRWVYAAGVLVALHYIWLVKNYYTEPIIYTTILAILLALRFDPIRRAILARRRGRKLFSPSPLPRGEG